MSPQTAEAAMRRLAPLGVEVDGIPAELRRRPQWVVWKREHRPGDPKPTKVPYDAKTGHHASHSDLATWASFEQALGAHQRGGYDGIGYVFAGADPYVGTDLDDCRDPETGTLQPWAQEIVDRLCTYTELSPSGTGLHLIGRGKLPGTGRKRPYETGAIEQYDQLRFFTITGIRLDGTPAKVEDRGQAILALHREVWPAETPAAPRPANTPSNLDDAAVLETAFRASNGGAIHALWNGDTSAFGGDESRADASLCAHLAFYVGDDPERIDRLFRQSGLYRPKWDRQDYRERTITRALSGLGATYSGSRRLIVPNGHATHREESDQSDVTPPRAAEAPWPAPLADEAFYGLAGELVRAIEPYSEADAAALLGHALTGLGALIGPRVYAIAGDARHPCRLNVAIVGASSKGRKGSAQRPIERTLRLADMTFAARSAEGASSGEGLIWQVRDPITKHERTGKGTDRHTEEVEVDPGVTDKRLWVVESEFATVLRVLQREGNTLSAVIRRAWDSGDLRTLTKNSPAVATGAHICIVGHVTKDELLRYLDRSEMGNGFANRFLWLAAKRGRILPDGEQVPPDVLEPLADAIADVRTWAAYERHLRRDSEAQALWHDVYARLSEGAPGMFGAATNRAEAQVLRLSVLYAALDRSDVITAEHLLAALAVWEYAERSARWVFGDSTGEPDADSVLAVLRRSGPLPRAQIVELFGRHMFGARLDRALQFLLLHGLACVVRDTATGGRPAEVWHATQGLTSLSSHTSQGGAAA